MTDLEKAKEGINALINAAERTPDEKLPGLLANWRATLKHQEEQYKKAKPEHKETWLFFKAQAKAHVYVLEHEMAKREKIREN